MARKSRKNRFDEAVAQVENNVVITNRVPTALYARLSEENNGYETDDSIKTQIKLVEDYIAGNENLILVERFVDNGFTGTNFERPEFMRLMEKVKHGEIRCIVVKDLSRFGRDYLETGYYIESVFPLLGVRLIAVTDDFDSSRPSDRDSLTIPIKNMVNAMYAKDVSRKQIAARELKKKMGIYDVPIAPYGYQFSENEKKLQVDPELAPFVKMLFAWTLIGVSRSEIANRFNAMQVPTPQSVRAEKGISVRESNADWNSHTVKGILNNPVYAGIVVFGKQKQSLFQGIAKRNVDREEWIRFYNKHEPLVALEDYNEIEKMIHANKEKRTIASLVHESDRDQFEDCFHGMIYCGECGCPMPFSRGTHKHKESEGAFSFAYYRCINRKAVSKCKNQRIQQNFLKIIVMDQVQMLLQTFSDRKELLRKIKKDETQANALRILRRGITSKQGKLKNLRDKKASIYADFAEGILDDEDYQLMKEQVISDIQKVEMEIQRDEQKFLEMTKAINSYIHRVEELEKALAGRMFDSNVISQLIQKIVIYDGNRVEIVFRCEDVIQDYYVEQCLVGMGESEK